MQTEPLPAPRYPAKIAGTADAVARIRALPRPLVFTNGVFDLLHRGHVTYLEQAKGLGASLAVAVGYTPTVNDTFTIIDKQSTGAVAGTFLGLPEGGTFNAGGNQFAISYVGGNGNDVVLTVTAVPEPGVIGLAALGGIGLLARRRRQAK